MLIIFFYLFNCKYFLRRIAVKRFKKNFKSPSKTVVYTAQIPPAEIAFVNSIIESYEGIGIMRTIDRQRGIIEIHIMDWATQIFTDITKNIEKEISFTVLNKETVKNEQ